MSESNLPRNERINLLKASSEMIVGGTEFVLSMAEILSTPEAPTTGTIISFVVGAIAFADGVRRGVIVPALREIFPKTEQLDRDAPN